MAMAFFASKKQASGKFAYKKFIFFLFILFTRCIGQFGLNLRLGIGLFLLPIVFSKVQ